MSLYYFLDFMLLGTILFLSYYAYKMGIYEKLFEYFKLFVLISCSAKFASTTGAFLHKIHLFDPDSFAILVLIGFVLNILVLFYLSRYTMVFLNQFINSVQLRIFTAKIVTVLEVVLIVTFMYYMFMQLSLSKKHLYPFVKKSYSYTYIKQFYLKFLNDDFVRMILSSDTGTNHKEILFKSFKNSF